MKRLRAFWASTFGDSDRRVRLGRILGLVFIIAGFVIIYKAWDGSANISLRVDSQVPYLLSGGAMGLGLIVVGSVLLLLATVRAEREVASEKFDEVVRLLSRNLNRLQISTNGSGHSEQVVATTSTYHRIGCRVLEGKSGLITVTVEQAGAEGLEACRVCDPPAPRESKSEETASSN